jgi:hypothetical protein
MGASWFQINRHGKSLEDAYDTAREMAIEESGNDSYNGTISTTHQCADLTAQFKRSGKSLKEYIDMQMDKLHKRDCAAICIEEPKANTNKTKSQVEHIVTPGTKKWILKYEVEHYYGDSGVIASCPQKGDAVKMARAYTERTQIPTSVIMRKLLIGPKPTVAKITYKKATNERDGEWIFFGYAAE